MTVSSSEGGFLFVAFFDPYPMVSAGEIQLGETFGLS